MKYLHQHTRVIVALSEWADGQQLITASFYFWHAGSDLQKSQRGLLQTLLYYVLRQCPQLVPAVCHSHWDSKSPLNRNWSREDLRTAFEILKKTDIGSARFCFFVDGLDEYQGEHTDIIDIINCLISGDKVKVVLSSRPWNVFEDAYGSNPSNRLNVHEFTEGDIKSYVVSKFQEDHHFRMARGLDERYQALIQEIVDRAHGVFLWVTLVVNSLRRGMRNRDTIEELQERLQSLPTDLEDFFHHMLESVEKTYRKQAARIYLMCLAATGDLSLVRLSFFDRKHDAFALEEELRVWSIDNTRQLRQRARIRVLARCVDLLEISPDGTAITFLHRTVHEFLMIPNVQKDLRSSAGPGYDADLHLSNAVVCEIKHLSPHGPKGGGWLDHCTSLMREFLRLAHIIDVNGSTAYLTLLDELDRVIGIFRGNTSPIFSSWVPVNLAARYPPNWPMVAALKQSLMIYLTQEAHMNALKSNNIFVGRPALDIVLRSHINTYPYAQPLSPPDPTIVAFLLDLGADPNGSHEQSSIWELYLRDLAQSSNLEAEESHSNVAEIVRTLLAAGADPVLKGSEHYLATVLEAYCSSEDRNQIRTMRQQSQSKVEKDRPRGEDIRAHDASTDLAYPSITESAKSRFRHALGRLANKVH